MRQLLFTLTALGLLLAPAAAGQIIIGEQDGKDNLSDTEPAIAIVARHDPSEQEHVVLYPKEQQN